MNQESGGGPVRFRRKPKYIDAIQFTGDNHAEIIALWDSACEPEPVDEETAHYWRHQGQEPPETMHQAMALGLERGAWAFKADDGSVGVYHSDEHFMSEFEEVVYD